MWKWTGKMGRDRDNNRTAECRCSCGFVSMIALTILHRRRSSSCLPCAVARRAKGEPKPLLDLSQFPPLAPKVRKQKKDVPETEQGREIKELLARARQGDTAPFLLRVQEYARIAAGLNLSSEVEDVAQETALTALRKLDQIDEDGNIIGWVFMVARSFVMVQWRGEARRRRLLGFASEGKIKIAQ